MIACNGSMNVTLWNPKCNKKKCIMRIEGNSKVRMKVCLSIFSDFIVAYRKRRKIEKEKRENGNKKKKKKKKKNRKI